MPVRTRSRTSILHHTLLAAALATTACAVEDPAALGSAEGELAAEAPPLFAVRESYLQAQIVAGRPLPPPISRAVGGTFSCAATSRSLGVSETRTADGEHVYRLRCARLTLRGVVEDHLALTLDERRATDLDRGVARACVAAFGLYHTPRNDVFDAELGVAGVHCTTGTSTIATALATSAATGVDHVTVITPGLVHPSVPADVVPAAPLVITPQPGQIAPVPSWAIAPVAQVVLLTSTDTPIRLSVQSRANPADLTTYDPAAYPSEIIGYTLQYATEPTGATSCADWHDAPGLVDEHFVALHDTPVFPHALPSGVPTWVHDLEVPRPAVDLGGWTDDAHLSHTYWLRAVPRGPVLGEGQPSPCAFTPSNWIPIGLFDDALYQQHLFAGFQQILADYLARQPYNPHDLYDVQLELYAPPRLVTRVPIVHPITLMGTDIPGLAVPTMPMVSEVDNEWGAHRGLAFDPWVKGNQIAAAHSHWYDPVVAIGNLIVDGLSALSELYETAKTFVADTVATMGCAQVPIDGCHDFVAAAAKAGIEYGLASMGVPPHIPNARELMEHGVDYLASMAADEVAAQVPGGEVIAQETARELADVAARALIHDALATLPLSHEYDNDDPTTWGQPDPFYLAHPATITIAIRPKQPDVYAQILADEPQRVPDVGYVVLRDLLCGYGARTFRLPRVIPASGIRVTLPLTAGFEIAAPGSSLPGQGCSVETPTAWANGFGALDPSNEASYGVRYPSSTRSYFFALNTYDWHTQTLSNWDLEYARVGLARYFSQPQLTPTDFYGVPVPKPLL